MTHARELQCQYCLLSFQPSGSRPRRRYCSDVCRTAANRNGYKQRQTAARKRRRNDPSYRRAELERDYKSLERRRTDPKFVADESRKNRDYKLRRDFNITIEDYERLFDAQHGLCAICSQPQKQEVRAGTGTVKWLAVDHDHITGQVRGLLCSNCNKGLGFLGDSVLGLMRAVDYLQATMQGPCRNLPRSQLGPPTQTLSAAPRMEHRPR